MSNTSIQTTGKPIWERLFGIKMRYKDTVDLNTVEIRGVPTTGDSQWDKALLNDWVYKYITIDQMVEYHRNGIAFVITDHKETKDIYEIIHAYLHAWKEHIQNGINIGNAPIDDLMALDALATSMYDHASEHIRAELTPSPLYNWMQKQGGLSRSFMSARRERLEEDKKNADDENREVKKHESLADIFSSAVISRRIY